MLSLKSFTVKYKIYKYFRIFHTSVIISLIIRDHEDELLKSMDINKSQQIAASIIIQKAAPSNKSMHKKS